MRQLTVLVIFKALATLRTERKRTYLGFLWWFFEPLFLMLVFYILFDRLLDRGGEDFVPVLLTGLVFWQWFGNSIPHCMLSIRNALPLMRSVRVEPEVFPLATLLSDSVKFMLVLVVLLTALIALGYSPGLSWVALPAVLFVELVLTCGVCLIVAATVPLLPDLQFVISPLLQGMFFLSGVFFTIDSVSPDMRHYLEWNPMAVLIDCGRSILLYNEFPDPWRLARVFLAAVVCLGIGVFLLRILASKYPKLPD